MNARCASKSGNRQARIVGQSRQAGAASGGAGLECGVVGKGLAGLLRLGQAEIAGRLDRDPQGFQQLFDFADFARIVAGDHDLADARLAHRRLLRMRRFLHSRFQSSPRALRCRMTSSATPFSARCRSDSNWVREKGFSSAVPWTSTMPPDPVSTKLASAWALESSA